MNKTLKYFIVMSIIIFLFGFFVLRPLKNYQELDNCRDLDSFMEVIFEDNFVFDKCFIVENEEEFTINKYRREHKFEGLEVRE